MNKKTIVYAIIVLFIIIILIIVKNINKTNGELTNPGLVTTTGQDTAPTTAPAYNPPKEIKYNESTDLKKELESINPEVLDSDFEGI